MTVNVSQQDAVDRGRPYRMLLDGTHEATIIACEQYQKNSLSLKVEVVVHPRDQKAAPEGPVICTTYLPAEITDKVRDLYALAKFGKALGYNVGTPYEERDQIGKPIRVVTKWKVERGESQYRDKAEIVGFLPALPNQKPIALPEAPEQPEDPFAGVQ